MSRPVAPTITFDVFSALIDSRTGASRFLAGLHARRGSRLTAAEIYDEWDRRNKELHAACTAWRPWIELACQAMSDTYRDHRLPGDARQDCLGLAASMRGWPLWPDVARHAPAWPPHTVGLLSNIDDDLLATTAAASLAMVDPAKMITSETLGRYKPASGFYRSAADRLGPVVHVAASARDVRGALLADLPCIRLVRPGHDLDPAGPAPRHSVTEFGDLLALIRDVSGDHGTWQPARERGSR